MKKINPILLISFYLLSFLCVSASVDLSMLAQSIYSTSSLRLTGLGHFPFTEATFGSNPTGMTMN